MSRATSKVTMFVVCDDPDGPLFKDEATGEYYQFEPEWFPGMGEYEVGDRYEITVRKRKTKAYRWKRKR